MKKEFLGQFVSHLCDQFLEIKQILIAEVTDFSEFNHFDFKMSIRNRAPSIYEEYELQKEIFVAAQVKQLFEPLGISEQSTVIW